jgi:ribose/xylose/arabinose/galactoside ABC-type transport system permease subunit
MRGRLPALIARTGIYWLLLVLVVGAAAAIPAFRTAENLANVLIQSAPLGVLAVGQTLVIIAGLIDLSVGQLAGLAVVLVCALAEGSSAWTLPVICLALLLGATVGAVNGVLANRLRLDPLILTFGMLSVLQGIIFVWTDRSIGRAPPELVWLANGRLLGVPVALLLVAAVALAAHWVLRRTRLGLDLAALGGSEESARRVGVPTNRVRLAAFVMSGLSAGLAGILIAGRLGTGYPIAGAGYELDAIVAVVLGGTALAGGRGSVAGTLAAVLVLGLVSNILNLLEISAFVQMVAKGLIVILAILANQPRAQPRAVPA